MLKEVGASGQISLGKKYAGQLFDVTIAQNGSMTLIPVKVVPATLAAREELASYTVKAAPPGMQSGDGYYTPERMARKAAAAARTPAETQALQEQWEADNKEAIEAFNKRMRKIGSMGRRVYEWRKARAQREEELATVATASKTPPVL